LLSQIGTIKYAIGNAIKPPASLHLINPTGAQQLASMNALKLIILRHLLSILLSQIGTLKSAIGNAINNFEASHKLNLTGTQHLVHTNATVKKPVQQDYLIQAHVLAELQLK
jgi:hypothetical protein